MTQVQVAFERALLIEPIQIDRESMLSFVGVVQFDRDALRVNVLHVLLIRLICHAIFGAQTIQTALTLE